MAAALTTMLLLAGVAAAQPSLVSYQGQLNVSGTPFTGNASFKFAILCGASSAWSNDGTSTGGSQPAAAVTLPVAQGVFSVLLGDPSLSMVPLTGNLVNSCTSPTLRVWVDSGTGFEQLSDQPLASSPFALKSSFAGGAIGTFSVGDGTSSAVSMSGTTGRVNLSSIRFSDGTLQTTAATGTGADNDWVITGNDMSAGVTGNVGIGTPTPQTKLHLSSTGDAPEIRLNGDSTMLSGEVWGAQSLYNLNTTLLGRTYWKGGTALAPDFTIDARNKIDAFTVDGATGVVGIHTPTPSTSKSLTLQGVSANSGWLQFRTNAGVDAWHLTNEAGGLNFVESGVAANRLVLMPGGNVGVGTGHAGRAAGGGRQRGRHRQPDGAGDHHRRRWRRRWHDRHPVVGFLESDTNLMDVHRSNVILNGRTAGQGLTFEAPIYLPDGATITGFEIHVTDSDATRNVQTFLLSHPFTAGAGAIIATLATSGTPGRTVMSNTSLNTVVNNTTNHYVVACNWTTPTHRDRGSRARHAGHLHAAMRNTMKILRAAALHLVLVALAATGAGATCIDYASGPVLLGNADTGTYAWDVAVAGDLAFVADDAGNLAVVDVSDPDQPAVIGNVDLPGRARSVAVAGELRLRRGRIRQRPGRVDRDTVESRPARQRGHAGAGLRHHRGRFVRLRGRPHLRPVHPGPGAYRARRNRPAAWTRRGSPRAWPCRAATPTWPMAPTASRSSRWATRSCPRSSAPSTRRAMPSVWRSRAACCWWPTARRDCGSSTSRIRWRRSPWAASTRPAWPWAWPSTASTPMSPTMKPDFKSWISAIPRRPASSAASTRRAGRSP